MKKTVTFFIASILMLVLVVSNGCTTSTNQAAESVSETQQVQVAYEKRIKTFSVYSDKGAADNHFMPSGWMGDAGDLKLDQAWMDKVHSGSTCIQIIYTAEASNGAKWAGIYWQNPPNNWGDQDGGYNLEGATRLTFWARGAEGGERIEEFKLGGLNGKYGDSDTAGMGPIILTNEWKQYSIDLAGKDLSYVVGGFAFATNVDVNPYGATFYIDDIQYEFGNEQELS